ncbi:hypothetical protein [Aquimarina rhabdastrellae]
MDSQHQFFKIIYTTYTSIAGSKIPDTIIRTVAAQVAHYYHNQYYRFRKSHPKSKARYSSFDINDLKHPITYEIIITLLKKHTGKEYLNYASILLELSIPALKKFEDDRMAFYDMF